MKLLNTKDNCIKEYDQRLFINLMKYRNTISAI